MFSNKIKTKYICFIFIILLFILLHALLFMSDKIDKQPLHRTINKDGYKVLKSIIDEESLEIGRAHV